MDTLLNLFEGDWLPYVFAFLLGFSLLVYIILDGYDLGVGILSMGAGNEEKDKMISSIAPFWDANETWLVLGGGLMLVGFPLAQGIVFQSLYIPVAIMLTGLILRGVSFDFRSKVPQEKKRRWDLSFMAGSLITVLAQGYMLGVYMMGFAPGGKTIFFGCLVSLLAVAAVCLVGGGWLLMKTEGELQHKARYWTEKSLLALVVLMVIAGILTYGTGVGVHERWIEKGGSWIMGVFVLIGLVFAGMYAFLRKNRATPQKRCWIPFALTVLLFILNFSVLAYTFYPWIIMDKLSLAEAAAARDSLMIVLVGTLITLPVLITYTIVVYRIFHGKVRNVSYE